jgi:hypothetical protein
MTRPVTHHIENTGMETTKDKSPVRAIVIQVDSKNRKLGRVEQIFDRPNINAIASIILADDLKREKFVLILGGRFLSAEIRLGQSVNWNDLGKSLDQISSRDGTQSIPQSFIFTRDEKFKYFKAVIVGNCEREDNFFSDNFQQVGLMKIFSDKIGDWNDLNMGDGVEFDWDPLWTPLDDLDDE